MVPDPDIGHRIIVAFARGYIGSVSARVMRGFVTDLATLRALTKGTADAGNGVHVIRVDASM